MESLESLLVDDIKQEISKRLIDCHQECIHFMNPFLNVQNVPLLEVSLKLLKEKDSCIHGGLFYDSDNPKKLHIEIDNSYWSHALKCCNNCRDCWLLTRDYICAHETGHYLHFLENLQFFEDYEISCQAFRNDSSFKTMNAFARLDTFREFVAEVFALAYFSERNKLESVIDFAALSYPCCFDLLYGFFINNSQLTLCLSELLKFSVSEANSFMDSACFHSLPYSYPSAKSSEDYFFQCCKRSN